MALITKSIVTVPESTVAAPESMTTVHTALYTALQQMTGPDSVDVRSYQEIAREAIQVGNLAALRSAFLRIADPQKNLIADSVGSTVLRAKVAEITADSAFFEGRMVAVAEDFLADWC